jgi:hypothetical protein
MAIILKANKVNLFVSSVLFVFWYHSPNISDTPRSDPVSLLHFLYAGTTGAVVMFTFSATLGIYRCACLHPPFILNTSAH